MGKGYSEKRLILLRVQRVMECLTEEALLRKEVEIEFLSRILALI